VRVKKTVEKKELLGEKESGVMTPEKALRRENKLIRQRSEQPRKGKGYPTTYRRFLEKKIKWGNVEVAKGSGRLFGN